MDKYQLKQIIKRYMDGLEEKYDISQEELKKKVDEISPFIKDPTSDDQMANVAREGTNISDLTIDSFKTSDGINEKELNKFLSVCLNRESIIEAIVDVETYKVKTRAIALSNPLCPMQLLRDVKENLADNYYKFETLLAKNEILYRERKVNKVGN